MGLEVERKFKVLSDAWRESVVKEQEIRQGYLMLDSSAGKELRVRTKGGKAFQTFKAKTASSTARQEFEYEIPLQDANEMLDGGLCIGSLIEKVRYTLHDGFEVDVFSGRNAGLVLAEMEFPSLAAAAAFNPPTWVGADVTDQKGYKNAQLAQKSFSEWETPAPKAPALKL